MTKPINNSQIPKKQHPTKRLKSFFYRVARSYTRHTYIYSVALCILYIILFQTSILTSGDNWGEAFYEYVHGALADNMQGFFKLGIAGYFNFLPKLFSYSYVIVGLPLQYVDYYFRAIVIFYSVCCVAFIGHGYNRDIIKSDPLRSLFTLMALMMFYHVSSLSFINVWYVGFIPIILISLNGKKFNQEWQAVLYAMFAMSVCLTKPSLILLPLVIYRMVRLKEYLLGSIVLFAIMLQTALFFTSQYYHTVQSSVGHSTILSIAENVSLYIGVLFLKIFQFTPYGFPVVVAATAVVAIILTILYFYQGVVRTGTICLTLLLAAYTSIYAPDVPGIKLTHSYAQVYYDQLKLQRELVVYFIIIFMTVLVTLYIYEELRSANKSALHIAAFIPIVILLVLAVSEYRPIKTRTSDVYVNIDPFRNSLRSRNTVCMPVPPTPSWVPYGFKGGPTYGWYFETGKYGECLKSNYLKTIDYESFSHKISGGINFTIDIDFKIKEKNKQNIKSILIPTLTPKNQTKARTLILTNLKTKNSYTATIQPNSADEHLMFVAFNLPHESPQAIYNYRLSEPGNSDSEIMLGRFTDNSLANFAFFITK